MSIEQEFDDWYQSDEFKDLIVQATKASYHDAYSDFLVWEKETRELVNRIHAKKGKEATKLDIWKKISKEFGFAEKWEHRLSDNLSISHPDIFSMGLNDSVEPDIVNLVSPMHGIEFKTRVITIEWLTSTNKFGVKKAGPAFSKKSATGVKEWYPYTISAWRNCPVVFKHDKVAVANPNEILFGKINPEHLKFGQGRTACLSIRKLIEHNGCESIFAAPKATYPKWYR